MRLPFREVNCDLGAMVKVTVFLKDMKNYAALNELYKAEFKVCALKKVT